MGRSSRPNCRAAAHTITHIHTHSLCHTHTHTLSYNITSTGCRSEVVLGPFFKADFASSTYIHTCTFLKTTHRRIQEVGLGAFFKADPASSTALAGLEWLARSAFNAAEGAGLCPVCDCMCVFCTCLCEEGSRASPSTAERASWRRAQTQPFFQIAPCVYACPSRCDPGRRRQLFRGSKTPRGPPRAAPASGQAVPHGLRHGGSDGRRYPCALTAH